MSTIVEIQNGWNSDIPMLPDIRFLRWEFRVTVDGQIIQTPGQFYPPRPPNFKVVVFFQGLRRVDKTNQTPQHDISRTHSLTLTFGEGGVFQSFPRGLNILSIYGPGR